MTALNAGSTADRFAPLSAVNSAALADSMDKSGVGVRHDIVPDGILAQLRSVVAHQIEQQGSQYFAFSGGAWITGTCLGPLFEDAGLHELLRSLYERKMRTSPPSNRILPVLRTLTGTQGLRHTNVFHYDSYVVTVLLPILIPDGPDEPPGHLTMFPNLRNARRFAVVNILEKWLWKNC